MRPTPIKTPPDESTSQGRYLKVIQTSSSVKEREKAFSDFYWGAIKSNIYWQKVAEKQQVAQEAKVAASKEFFTGIGYPQYGGKYSPFNVPLTYRVASITETPQGLSVTYKPTVLTYIVLSKTANMPGNPLHDIFAPTKTETVQPTGIEEVTTSGGKTTTRVVSFAESWNQLSDEAKAQLVIESVGSKLTMAEQQALIGTIRSQATQQQLRKQLGLPDILTVTLTKLSTEQIKAGRAGVATKGPAVIYDTGLTKEQIELAAAHGISVMGTGAAYSAESLFVDLPIAVGITLAAPELGISKALLAGGILSLGITTGAEYITTGNLPTGEQALTSFTTGELLTFGGLAVGKIAGTVWEAIPKFIKSGILPDLGIGEKLGEVGEKIGTEALVGVSYLPSRAQELIAGVSYGLRYEVPRFIARTSLFAGYGATAGYITSGGNIQAVEQGALFGGVFSVGGELLQGIGAKITPAIQERVGYWLQTKQLVAATQEDPLNWKGYAGWVEAAQAKGAVFEAEGDLGFRKIIGVNLGPEGEDLIQAPSITEQAQMIRYSRAEEYFTDIVMKITKATPRELPEQFVNIPKLVDISISTEEPITFGPMPKHYLSGFAKADLFGITPEIEITTDADQEIIERALGKITKAKLPSLIEVGEVEEPPATLNDEAIINKALGKTKLLEVIPKAETEPTDPLGFKHPAGYKWQPEETIEFGNIPITRVAKIEEIQEAAWDLAGSPRSTAILMPEEIVYRPVVEELTVSKAQVAKGVTGKFAASIFRGKIGVWPSEPWTNVESLVSTRSGDQFLLEKTSQIEKDPLQVTTREQVQDPLEIVKTAGRASIVVTEGFSVTEEFPTTMTKYMGKPYPFRFESLQTRKQPEEEEEIFVTDITKTPSVVALYTKAQARSDLAIGRISKIDPITGSVSRITPSQSPVQIPITIVSPFQEEKTVQEQILKITPIQELKQVQVEDVLQVQVQLETQKAQTKSPLVADLFYRGALQKKRPKRKRKGLWFEKENPIVPSGVLIKRYVGGPPKLIQVANPIFSRKARVSRKKRTAKTRIRTFKVI